jgi:putative SOS response-associated peptidase YedK
MKHVRDEGHGRAIPDRAQRRCLVPFTSFSEYDTIDGRKVPIWFAPDETRPLLCFAGLWTNWTSVRKAHEGEVTADVFSFLASRTPKWPASIPRPCR